MRSQVVLSPRGYFLFDDTVLDKHHSRRSELVRRQYSGNAHSVLTIDLVTCVYADPKTDQFWPINYLMLRSGSLKMLERSLCRCSKSRFPVTSQFAA